MSNLTQQLLGKRRWTSLDALKKCPHQFTFNNPCEYFVLTPKNIYEFSQFTIQCTTYWFREKCQTICRWTNSSGLLQIQRNLRNYVWQNQVLLTVFNITSGSEKRLMKRSSHDQSAEPQNKSKQNRLFRIMLLEKSHVINGDTPRS